MNHTQDQDTQQANEFSRGAQQAPSSTLGEFWDFLAHNKKWWLTPIILSLLLVGVIIIFGSTAAAPFIYTLF